MSILRYRGLIFKNPLQTWRGKSEYIKTEVGGVRKISNLSTKVTKDTLKPYASPPKKNY